MIIQRSTFIHFFKYIANAIHAFCEKNVVMRMLLQALKDSQEGSYMEIKSEMLAKNG